MAYKEVFGEPQLLDFETIKISGHADPDAYLTKIYGDYMKLPEESEQKVTLNPLGRISLKSFTMMGVRIDPLTMAETVAATEKFVRDKNHSI